MVLKTITRTDNRMARAWYLKYPLDAYALGPARFDKMVTAVEASADGLDAYGERPCEVWPDGHTEECAEYEYEVDVPEEDDEE